MPRVLNKRTDKIPLEAVYVGRPSKWGNPFKIGVYYPQIQRIASRQDVLQLYVELIVEAGRLGDLTELKGRDLVCWCSPLPCHADVLLELANA